MSEQFALAIQSLRYLRSTHHPKQSLYAGLSLHRMIALVCWPAGERQPDTPHQSTNRQAMVSVAVSSSVMETCSSGQWAQPMSPAPYITHGMFARFTKNRMSAP